MYESSIVSWKWYWENKREEPSVSYIRNYIAVIIIMWGFFFFLFLHKFLYTASQFQNLINIMRYFECCPTWIIIVCWAHPRKTYHWKKKKTICRWRKYRKKIDMTKINESKMCSHQKLCGVSPLKSKKVKSRKHFSFKRSDSQMLRFYTYISLRKQTATIRILYNEWWH